MNHDGKQSSKEDLSSNLTNDDIQNAITSSFLTFAGHFLTFFADAANLDKCKLSQAKATLLTFWSSICS